MEQKELEFTNQMIEIIDIIDNATYDLCVTLLQYVNDKDVETKFPWDISILADIWDYAIQVLRERGYAVCDPCIVHDGTDRYCNLGECRMESCNLHP